MRRYGNAPAWQASRQETRRKTRRTDETRNETAPTTPTARMDRIAGRWQLVFLCAVLISSSLRPSPRLPPRSVAPGLSFRSAPRASARFSFYRSARFISSSRHLVLLSCRFYRHPVGACPIHGGGLAAGAGNWDGGGIFFMRRFPQLIIVRPVIRFSSSGGRRPIVVGLTGRSRRCPLIISSGSSHSSPLPHLITERRRWCLSYFKQATTTWRSPRLIISSHHLIPSPSSYPSPVSSSPRLAPRVGGTGRRTSRSRRFRAVIVLVRPRIVRRG